MGGLSVHVRVHTDTDCFKYAPEMQHDECNYNL